jgi:hypothetical protein
MKNHWLQIRLVILAALLLTFPVQAQQQVTDEENIKVLRTNIQRMVANAPPATTPDENHRKTVLSLRGQLVRLLLKKSGALESRIGNLEAPGALPEVKAYAAQLRSDLKALNDEIGSLDQALGGTLPAPLAAATPQPALDPATAARNKNFENLVASISPSDLATAALPDAVASTPPSCNVNGTVAGAQASAYDRALCQLAGDVANNNNRPIDLSNDQAALMTILVAKLLRANQGEGESYAAFVTEAQENRIDQQMGAGPTSNSATSIVSKGGIPYLFGFAVENGAATRTEKDTSITFRLNPGGLVNLFADRGFITGYQASENDPLLKFLRKSSIGLTFDTSRGDTPDVFTGRGQQLSEISARYEFFNDRDPRKRKYAAMWERFVANEMVKLSTQIGATTDALLDQSDKAGIKFKDPALEAWLIQLNKEVSNVDPALTGAARVNAVAATINAQADKVPVALVSDTAVEAVSGFGREFKTYTQRKNELLDTIAKGRIFTIEYTNKREVNAPDTSNFNFIYATGNGRRVDLTANGSFTFFHSRPAAISPTSPRPGRIRDFQFAAQVGIPLRGDFDFWFSGRYERLMEDASLGSVVLPGTKGDIAVGQLGLNVPIKSLGMKFPVSVTFANRTELVKEKVVKGNFGFTFNWDTLLSKLKPF